MLNRLQLSNDLPLFSPFPPEREKRSFRARVAAIPLESVRMYVRSSNPLASITPTNILKRHDTVYGARGPFEFSDDSGNSCTWPPRAPREFNFSQLAAKRSRRSEEMQINSEAFASFRVFVSRPRKFRFISLVHSLCRNGCRYTARNRSNFYSVSLFLSLVFQQSQ